MGSQYDFSANPPQVISDRDLLRAAGLINEQNQRLYLRYVCKECERVSTSPGLCCGAERKAYLSMISCSKPQRLRSLLQSIRRWIVARRKPGRLIYYPQRRW